MANAINLELKLNPTLDVAKLNVLLEALKKSMGDLGKSISLIDGDLMEAELKKLDELFDREPPKILPDDLEEKLGKATKGADSFVKAFQFNQIAQAVNTLATGVSGLAQPFIALDTATANMRTLGDEAAEMSVPLREAAIIMSKELPFAAAELQTTMFDALASGVKGGEEGLKAFADTAAKLATGGGSGIGEATNLLAGQLNAYGKSAEDASKFADIFFNTVNYGVTSIPELSSTLANVIPTASSLGIELENVGGALALMTSKGIPTAQSTTKLNALLIELAKPGATLAPILEKAGVSLESLKQDDLPVTLKKVSAALKESGKAALQVFSSSEAGAAFNTLAGDLEGFSQTFADVKNTTGSAQFAYEQMSGSIEVQTKQMMSTVNAFVIQGLDFLGNGFVSAAQSATQLAPMITTLGGLGAIMPAGTLDRIKQFPKLMSGIPSSLNGALPAVQGFSSKISSAFAPLGSTIKNGFSYLKPSTIKDALNPKSLAISINNLVTGVSGSLQNINKSAVSSLGSIGAAFNPKVLLDKFTELKVGATSSLSTVGSSLTNSLNPKNIAGNFKSLGTQIGSSLKPSSILNNVKDLKKGIAGSLSGIDKLIAKSISGPSSNVFGGLLKQTTAFSTSMLSTLLPAFGKTAIAGAASGYTTATAWGAALAPITAVVLGVAALGLAFKYLYDNSAGFKSFVDETFGLIGKTAEEAWNIIVAGFNTVVSVATLLARPLIFPFELLFNIISSVAERLNIFGGEGADFASSFDKIGDTIGVVSDYIKTFIAAIKAGADGLNAFISSITGGIGDVIAKFLTGDFTGAIDAFGNLGKNGAEAFNKGVETSVQESKLDILSDRLNQQIDDIKEVDIKIKANTDLTGIINTYENIQKEITELEIKPKSELSDEDIQKLERLKTKAGELSQKIAEGASSSVESTKSVINANGEIESVYDININKAKEFAESQKEAYDGDLKKKQEGYSNNLLGILGVYNQQQESLKKLNAEAAKLNSEGKGEEAKKKNEEYLKLNSTINETRNKLVSAYQEGSKAGSVNEKTQIDINKALGLTNEEAKKMVESQQNSVDLAKQQKEEIEGLGKAFEAAADSANSTYKANFSALNGATLEYKKALKSGDKEAIASAKVRVAEMKKITKEAFAEKKNLDNIDEANKKLIEGQKEKTKQKETEYQIATNLYELEKKRLNNQLEERELEAEMSRILEGRDKNSIDDLSSQKAKLDVLNKQKLALQEQYKVSFNEKGEVVLGIKFKPEEDKAKLTEEVKMKIQEANNSIKKSEIDGLALQAKLTLEEKDYQKSVRDLEKQRLEVAIKLGTKTQDDLTKFIEEDLKNAQKELDDKKATKLQLTTSIQPKIEDKEAQLEQLKKSENLAIEIVANMDISEVEKDSKIKKIQDEFDKERNNVTVKFQGDINGVQASIKSIDKEILGLEKIVDDGQNNLRASKKVSYDEEFRDLQEKHKNELDEIEQRINAEVELSKILAGASYKSIESSLVKSKEKELSDLEKLKEERLKNVEGIESLELKVQEEFNKKKEALELDHQKKIQAMGEVSRGFELESERKASLGKLSELQKRKEEELRLAEQSGDTGRAKEIAKELDDIKGEIAKKGTLLTNYSEALEANLTDIFSNMFNDEEAIKEPWRKMFATIAGILKQQATAAVASIILGQLQAAGATTGLLAILASAASFGIANAAVSKILDPILAGLLSFATGGRVDEPTLAWVGDASKARPGADTEWIMRDDHINLIIHKAVDDSMEVIKTMFDDLEFYLQNTELSIDVDKIKLEFTSELKDFEMKQMSRSIDTLSDSINKFRDNMNLRDNTTEELVSIIKDTSLMKSLKSQYHSGNLHYDDYQSQIKAPVLRVKSYASGSPLLYSPELAVIGDNNQGPEKVFNMREISELVNTVVEKTVDRRNVELKSILLEINDSINNLELSITENEISTAVKRVDSRNKSRIRAY